MIEAIAFVLGLLAPTSGACDYQTYKTYYPSSCKNITVVAKQDGTQEYIINGK